MGLVWSYITWYWWPTDSLPNDIKNEQHDHSKQVVVVEEEEDDDDSDYIDPVYDDDTNTTPFSDDIITTLQLELTQKKNTIATQLLFQSCLECNLTQMKYIVNNYQPDVTFLYNIDRYYFRDRRLEFIDTSLKSLLHIASIHNSIKLIEYAINDLGFKERNQIDIEDHNGITPLALTTCCGNYHVMKYLIKNYNANINIQLYRYQIDLGYNGWTAERPELTFRLENLFYCALISNHIKILEFIYKKLKITDFNGWKYIEDEIMNQLTMKNAIISIEFLYQHSRQTLRQNSTNANILPHYAARIGSMVLIDRLIERNFKINNTSWKHEHLSTPIFDAIQYSQWDFTKVLIEQHNADVTIISPDRGSLLTELFKNKNATIEMCDYLLGLGVDINGGTNPQFKCLNVSLSNNNYTLFNHLIIQHNIIVGDWNSLLFTWCLNMKCTVDDVTMLEQHCPDLRQMLLSNEMLRQLMLQKCTIDVIQLLLGNEHDAHLRPVLDIDIRYLCQNADPNVLDYFLSFTTLSTSSSPSSSSTPIQLNTTLEQLFTYSFDGSNHLVAKLLIEKYQFNLKTTIPYHNLIKSLFSNALYVNKELLYYLNSLGYFDFDAPIIVGQTQTFPSFIHFILHPHSQPEIKKMFNLYDIKWLIEVKNINYHILNNKQQTILHLAQHHYKTNPSLVRYFIQLGVNIAQRDIDGRTFVHYSVLYNSYDQSEDMIKMLLKLNFIDLSDQDAHGKTLLHHAMEHGTRSSFQAKKLLLKLATPEQIHIYDNNGNASIYYSIQFQMTNELEMYVETKNFDIHSFPQQNKKQTILHYLLGFNMSDERRELNVAKDIVMILDTKFSQ